MKDAKGRVVNPRTLRPARPPGKSTRPSGSRPPRRLRKKAAQPLDAPADPAPGRKRRRGKGQGQAAPPAPGPAAGEGGEKARRTFPHGKQNLGNLEDFLAAQPVEEGAVSFPTGTP